MTSKPLYSPLYVFLDNAPQDPVVVGRLDFERITAKQLKTQFVYGKSYLQREKAFALDPLNLPLSEDTVISFDKNETVGVFFDAAPDLWGRQVIEVLYPDEFFDEREYFLFGNGQSVGALLFATQPHLALASIPQLPPWKTLEHICSMQAAAQQVALSKTVEESLKRYLNGSGSMGGAQPKTTVTIEGEEWLAKFGKPNEQYDLQKVEYANLQMASTLNIEVPRHKLIETPQGGVLLVARFDRVNNKRRHYISANALVSKSPVENRLDTPISNRYFSYLYLADITGRISSDPVAERLELFRRLVFNIAIRNVDDHLKNHGFLKAIDSHHYRLAPCFDVVTQIYQTPNDSHWLVTGPKGRVGTFANAIAGASLFGVKEKDAKAIVAATIAVVNNRKSFYEKAGLSAREQALLTPWIQKRLAS